MSRRGKRGSITRPAVNYSHRALEIATARERLVYLCGQLAAPQIIFLAYRSVRSESREWRMILAPVDLPRSRVSHVSVTKMFTRRQKKTRLSSGSNIPAGRRGW